MKAVGAHAALDYRSAGIGRDVAGAVAEAREGEGGFVGILDAVSSPETFRTISEILEAAVGAPTKVVTLMPTPEGLGRNYVGSHSKWYFRREEENDDC